MIQSAIGPITLRAPTEIEAIRFEDRHRASRRKAADGEVVEGALYDNGLEEVLACVTSHKAAELHPADDGLLSDSPGVYERLCDEFRRLGGGALALCDSADAITEDIRLSYGRKALGFEYGGIKLVVRKLSWAEFQAFIVEREDGNTWATLAKFGKRCMLTPTEDLGALWDRFPYLAMTVGAKLYDLAQGAVDTKLGKSANG